MSSEPASNPPLVLVTGATGLVGSSLCRTLARSGYRVRRALRARANAGHEDVVVGDIGADTSWTAALAGVEYVVHLAARTHILEKPDAEAVADYERVNVAGTRRLAEQAAAAGVRRLVFLSSVKVNGEVTSGRAFQETDTPCPEDPYGRTKRDAEDLLLRLARESALEVVVIRSPLIYGPGVKGNFERLMRYVARRLPLPLGSVDNRRSLIYVGNLADAILKCLERVEANGRVYLVSDGEDMSTPELLRAVGHALHVEPFIVPFPVAWLRGVAWMTGRSAELARLAGSLVVDTTRIRRELGWTPPYSAADGLRATAEWYHSRVNDRARADEAHRAL
jgi:nucleoside-diphosphate-sugar epimerase